MFITNSKNFIFCVFVLVIPGSTATDYYFGYGKDYFFGKEALSVMSYHRSKMNEYLCKNYVASEIVRGYMNQTKPFMEKRFGKPQKNSRLARESLLEDQGSQKYKDWLSRSSTLEDIYRQFEHMENEHGEQHQESASHHEGEVTGYALLPQKQPYAKPFEYTHPDTHHYVSSIESHPHGYYEEEEEEEEHDEKGLKLKELFHFALTAIAFLAFATFIIEVIMCLIEVPAFQYVTEPEYVLVPTNTGTGPASKAQITEVNRHERGLDLDKASMETLNVISSRILSSIEGLALLYEDDGQCLKRALCQNSKYSESLMGMQKIWLPLWSLGTSWIAGRLNRNKTLSGRMDTLQYLKATVMGLGKKECHQLYPNCNERRRRKKRRADVF